MFPLPLALELKIGAALIAVAALIAGYESWSHKLKAEGVAQCEAAHAEADRKEGERRAAAVKEIGDESYRMANRRVADAAGLAAADGRLHDRAAAALGSIVDTAPAAGRQAASEAAGVCSQLLERAGERLRILAATADASYDAGTACQRSYDALTR